MKGLKEIGLAEGDTFDRLRLDRVTQELTRQYNNRGKYNVEITPDRVAPGPQPRRRHHHDQGRQGGQDPHINLVGNEKFEDEDIVDSLGIGRAQLAQLVPPRRPVLAREALGRPGEAQHLLPRPRLRRLQHRLHPGLDQPRPPGHVHHRRRQRGRPVQGVLACRSPATPCCPRNSSRSWCWSSPKARSSRAACWKSAPTRSSRRLGNVGYAFAQVNPIPDVDRDSQDRRHQHAGRARPARERAPRRVQGQHPHQRRSDAPRNAPVRRQLVLAGRDRPLQDPPAGPGLLRDRRRRDRSRSPAATTRSTWSSTSRKPPRAASCSAWAISQLQRPDRAGPAVAEQLPRHRQPGVGAGAAQRLPCSATTSRSSIRTSPTTACRSATTCGGASSTTPTSTPRSTPATAAPAQVVLGLPITETDTVSRRMFGIDTNQILAFPRLDAAEPIVDYINALDKRTFHAWRAELGWARNSLDNFLTPDPRHAAARLAGSHAARLDRRVLQAQLQHLQVLAAVAPPGAQHARRTGLRRQLRRSRRDARPVRRRRNSDDCAPGARRPCRHRITGRRPAVLRELLRRWRALGARLPRQHPGSARRAVPGQHVPQPSAAP